MPSKVLLFGRSRNVIDSVAETVEARLSRSPYEILSAVLSEAAGWRYATNDHATDIPTRR
jgi:hypothetical protein